MFKKKIIATKQQTKKDHELGKNYHLRQKKTNVLHMGVSSCKIVTLLVAFQEVLHYKKLEDVLFLFQSTFSWSGLISI